jgi:2-dehydro-3-deoxyphosphogluconate aldolase/(4S)-4-hydroxy-2-oxoglutarate aldolase
VLDPEQVDRCVDAGARFVVSPGFDDEVVARCEELGVPVLPGTATATEVLRARRHGLRAVKFFPAEQSGGLPAIQAIASVVPDVRYMPTGGVGPDNVERYLRAPQVLAVGGSWMTPRNLIADRAWDEIRDRCVHASRVAKARPGPGQR